MKKFLLIPLLAIYTASFAETDYTKGVFIVNEDWYGHQNSTVNYLIPDDPSGEYWHYRVIQAENPGKELGCTNQFGAIWNGRFYFIAKQEKDPGTATTGGRITVADATTMKILYQSTLIDPSGKQCDGRSFVGVDEHKAYISTSNGVWVFNLDDYSIGGPIEGTANPDAGDGKPGSDPTGSLYFGQSGSMVLSGNRVFLAHQQAGIIVIDTTTDKVTATISMDVIAENAGVGSVVKAKDGSIWASVAKDTKGTGMTQPYLMRIDPNTLDTEKVALADGIFAPSNSWYAWTPDTFCASAVANTLYWSGGSNSWFTGKAVFKFDVATRTASKIIDLDAEGENWKIYGCSMRLHPLSDEIYISLYHEFSIPTYITRRYDADGMKIRDYSMIENYWFPSLPVFPQEQTPAGVDSITGRTDTSVTVRQDGSLHITGAEGRSLEIFNIQGTLVRSRIIEDNDVIESPTLPSGLYVARIGSATLKFRL